MLIRLAADQEHKLLQWAGSFTEAEVDSDVEPSGYELRISIVPGQGCFAEAIKGASVLELGEVELVLQVSRLLERPAQPKNRQEL